VSRAPLLPAPLALRLLALLIARKHREAFLGDLLEEYEDFILPDQGLAAARLWLWTTALRGVTLGFGHRVRNWIGSAVRVLGFGSGPDTPPKRDQMDILIQDLRYALRRLARSPGFTLVAVSSLALGIGANTAIFSIVNSLLLRGLPVESPEELVEIYQSEDDYPYLTLSYPDFADMRDANEVFSDVSAYYLFMAMTDHDDGSEAQIRQMEVVTGNYFSMLGVRPVVGRGFLPEEDATPGTHAVMVLGHQYWQSAFGGDPAVIGRSVRLNGHLFTVVGVAPETFKGMYPGLVPEFYVPMMMADVLEFVSGSRFERRSTRNLFAKGRLRPGVTVEQAGAAVLAISTALAEEYPDTNEGRLMSVLASEDVSVHPFVDKALVPIAGLLLTVVGLVLLIACANLASFLLARAADRQKEIAVRLALGARRSTLVRQLLTETVLLAGLGGVAGVVVAQWTITALLSFQPPIPIPINLDITIDRQVLFFTFAISILAGMFFGLLPALQSTKPDVAPTLRDEGRTTGSKGRFSLRNTLVVAQVALSLVLLIGAGLFVRSLQKAQAIDLGFYSGPAAIVWPNFEMSGLSKEEGLVFQDEFKARLRAIPGVTHVTMASRIPLGANIRTMSVLPEGVDAPPERDGFDVDATSVGTECFEAMDIPLARGRAFSGGDIEDSPKVVIISEAFARRFWPGDDPLGRTVESRGVGYEIVGVARDSKVRTLGEGSRPYIYFSASQSYDPALMYLVRGTGNAAQLVAESRTAVKELRSGLVILDIMTMNEHLAFMLFPPRMAALLLSVFGGLALLLSAVGLYGLVSYAVARRTREVGIRMSLGADAVSVVRMVVGSGMRLVVVGSVIGLVVSAAVTWLISNYLYGIEATDIATFVGIPMLLASVAFVAAYVPARRASRVNPVDALRSE
jgi:macrolide transport system ATP-binding/permease protein